MKFLRQNGNAIVAGLAELVIGILLFINPDDFMSGILKVIGGVFFVCGAICLLRYFRTEPAQAALEQNFSKGLVLILLGGILVLRTQQIIELRLLTQLYGIAILVIGLFKLQQSVDLLRLKARFWFLAGVNALLAIVFAVIILNDPPILWQLVAISLILEAVLDIAVLIMTGKRARQADEASEPDE